MSWRSLNEMDILDCAQHVVMSRLIGEVERRRIWSETTVAVKHRRFTVKYHASNINELQSSTNTTSTKASQLQVFTSHSLATKRRTVKSCVSFT